MRIRHPVRSLLVLVFACVAAAAPAQVAFDKVGGGLPGNLTFKIAGAAANGPYAIIYSLLEQQTSVQTASGTVTLAIPLDHLADTYSIPGFLGTTNNSGLAQVTLAAPNDPALDPLVISLQAVTGAGPYTVSNLIRVTPCPVGTFEPALNSPLSPIGGGGIATAADGELLFVGGSGPVAQHYKSRTEEWETFGATFGVGLFAQTTGLADGRVLFTGGLDMLGQPTANAAIYDPISGVTTTLTMAHARAGHGASLMGNGKVLVSGGFQSFDLTNFLAFLQGVQNTTEIFDPVAGTFAPGPNMLEARGLHTSTTLSSGQVLIAGGLSIIPFVNIPTISSTAYRFNPATNSFVFPSSMAGGRFLHSAVGLSNGKVLLAGGVTFDLATFLATLDPTTIVVTTLSDCQVYTPSLLAGSFATVTGMSQPRAGAGLAALPNGGALIAGGMTIGLDAQTAMFVTTPLLTADRYSSTPQAVTPTGSMALPRFLPVMASLSDGTIMVVGGGPVGAEIYQP